MRALLFETVTGQPILDLQVSDWSADTGILASDKLDVTVPAYTRWARSLDLKSMLVKDKHSVALIDERVEGVRRVLAAGPITSPGAEDDPNGKHRYKVKCRGIERLLKPRNIRLFPGWPLLDSAGKPTGTYDQTFQNLSYGTIMKRLITESEKFPGGALPIVYEADRVGVHERLAYEAVNGKSVLEAIDQIADLDDGIEYDFQPEIDEFDRITYRLITGTDAGRVITNGREHWWNLGGANPDVIDFIRDDSPTPTYTDAVFAGGKDADRVLLARAQNHSQIPDGLPRAEAWDSSHSSVSVQGTLDSWARGALIPEPEQMSFKVKAALAHTVRHGDAAVLDVAGHWDLPDGEIRGRVLSTVWKASDPDWVDVGFVREAA